MFAIDVAILVTVSLLWPSSAKPDSGELHWSTETYRRETARLTGLPAWRNDRWQAVALLLLTALIVYRFR